MNNHFYADDAQLYVILDSSLNTEKIDASIDAIRVWMAKNILKLNDSKTKILLVGSPYQIQKVHNFQVKVGGHCVVSTSEVRNLGAYFDNTMSMSSFVEAKCKSLSFQLRCIGKVENLLQKKQLNPLLMPFLLRGLNIVMVYYMEYRNTS